MKAILYTVLALLILSWLFPCVAPTFHHTGRFAFAFENGYPPLKIDVVGVVLIDLIIVTAGVGFLLAWRKP